MLSRSSARAGSVFRRPLLGAPLLCAPATHRSLSLWPSAPTTPPPAIAEASAPIPPTWTELTAPLTLPAPTFFEPASTLLLAVPPALGLSYVAFIPLMTLLIRGGSTLPLTLWQRARTQRYQEVVLPAVKKEQARVALETRNECRREGKSYEEYQKVFAKRAKKSASRVAWQLGAHPLLTLLLPPLLHVPIFIGTTLLLRDACARALTTLSITPASLATLPSSPDGAASTLTTSALANLHDLATTSVAWCPSLVLPDPNMALPLAVGLAALANVEVSAKTRRANAAAALESRGAGEVAVADVAAGRDGARAERAWGGSMSAAEKGRVRARRSRDLAAVPPAARRSYATPASASSPAPVSKEDAQAEAEYRREQALEPRAARIMTNALRFSAILFVPVASFAPSAVCLYWLTSNLFTLVQSSVFAWVDRRRERERRLDELIRRA